MNKPTKNKIWRLSWTAACFAASLICQPIEPNAGRWKTWIISSGQDFRVPPPPDAESTANELVWLKDFAAQSAQEKQTRDQIRFWDPGPVYRWMDYVTQRAANAQPLGVNPRAITYVPIAIYDTTVAVWESKYFYNRQRPNLNANAPNSPSYPSEYAAISAAAAEVLAYLVPGEAANFRAMGEEAGRSRLAAGVEYPSDYEAGLALGRRVAAEVIARARQDGTDSVWDGVVPTAGGPNCIWTGTNPGNVTATMWKPFLLTSASEFRPAPPPGCDSEQMQSELAVVRDFPRSTTAAVNSTTFTTNWKAFYWQSPTGTSVWPNVQLNKWTLEDHVNTPQAARANAALGVTMWDAFIASQDGKFAYWYPRPAQLDRTLVPLFPAPNFPSYPSNHSTFSTARATVLAHLFPDRADVIMEMAKEAGDSRIWAGIHYPMDNIAGNELGRKVALKVIQRISNDGSQ